LCGTDKRGVGQDESAEFVYDSTGQYNISNAFDNYEILTHRTEMQQQNEQIDNTDFINIPEILTTFGVFRLSDESSNGSNFIKTLERIYVNDQGAAALVPVNYERVGATQDKIDSSNVDIIGLSQTNLFYLNDGLVDGPAAFGSRPLYDVNSTTGTRHN